jgi:hypothetical protein
MGMSLSIKRTTYGASENQEWLGSHEGTQSMDSITLDAALCVAKFATGLVPSGIPLKRQGTGRYAPAVTAEVPDYHLFTTVDLTAGGTIAVASAENMPASGMWRGEIIAAKVPTYASITSVVAANTSSGQFRYV